MAATELLDTALAIGRRLARRALWEGTACTWDVVEPQPGPASRVRTMRAEGQLYQGTAGLAWFLGELYRATREAEVGRAARGGLEHALARGDHLADLFGFHSGRVGIAWVAVRLAEIFERPDYAGRARRLLAPLAGREPDDAALDVIGGAGGAIPACLDLAEKTGWDELRAIARELGEHLIASPEPPPESGVSFLCHQEGNDIRCRRVGLMAALVLEAASEPASLDEIVARVVEAAGIARPGAELAGKVRTQLRELYGADLVGVC
jgi:hypothetical protein